jgi:hypothetical protein
MIFMHWQRVMLDSAKTTLHQRSAVGNNNSVMASIKYFVKSLFSLNATNSGTFKLYDNIL